MVKKSYVKFGDGKVQSTEIYVRERVGKYISRFMDSKGMYLASNGEDIYTSPGKDDGDACLFFFDETRYLPSTCCAASIQDNEGNFLEYSSCDGLKLFVVSTIIRGESVQAPDLYMYVQPIGEICEHLFETQGVVVLEGVFDEEDCRNDGSVLASTRHRSISNPLKYGDFEDYFTSGRIYRFLKKYLGEDFSLSSFSAVVVRDTDRDNRFWHVDYPYHNMKSPYPNEIQGIQMIIPLTPFLPETGATVYLPKSYNYHCYPDFDTYESLKGETPIIANPGDVILFRADLWHTQGINTTCMPRVALLANFVKSGIPPKDDVYTQFQNVCLSETYSWWNKLVKKPEEFSE